MSSFVNRHTIALPGYMYSVHITTHNLYGTGVSSAENTVSHRLIYSKRTL